MIRAQNTRTRKARVPALVLDSTIKPLRRDRPRNLSRKLLCPHRRGGSSPLPPPHPTRWDSSARPTLTAQPHGPARGGRPKRTPESPTAVPASPHPLLVPLHFPPGLATHHPHFSSLPVASLRSSVITWRSTAPPLPRTHVTSPSRPGGKRKAEREIHKNLTLNWLWYLILLIYLKYHLVIPDTEPSIRPHFSLPKTPKKEKLTQTTKSRTHRQWGRKLRAQL